MEDRERLARLTASAGPRHVIDLQRLLRAKEADEDYYKGVLKKGVPAELVDQLLVLYKDELKLKVDTEAKRTLQNAISKDIGQTSPDERPALLEQAAALKAEAAILEREWTSKSEELRTLWLQVPNPADPDVPDGGEDDGEVVRVVGVPPASAPPLDHAAFAAAMGFVETEHAVDMSGSRFASVMGQAVLVELALVRWVVDRLVAKGFVPVVPPVMVREQAMEEAGFFPTDRNQVYEVDGGELFLVGTAEVPLSSLHRGERLDAESLPRRYAGISTCFRREAGTYGKDTAGIFRVHQFDKIEMFSFASPEASDAEHEYILAIEEEIIGGLGLPYRVVKIATGDLGAAAAKKYDIEVWLPSEGRYREATSCSNYRDFSARRLDTRVKLDKGSEYLHTLNGTGCAVGRTLVYLFEHYQDNGAFVVPDALRALTGFDRVEHA